MQEIAWMFYIGKSTVHYIVKDTCKALWDILAQIVLNAAKTEAEWYNIMNEFYNRWNMPNCIGALDGKHVVIQALKHSGADFYSYKKNFSLVLMAYCDEFYCFTLVDIGAEGSQHDGTILRSSPIPKERKLPFTNTLIPCFVVADQAFPLNKRIMRPSPGERLDNTKAVFNYRLTRARRCIENAFGILTQRWRILRKPIVANIETCKLVTQACVVLHNFIQNCEENIPLQERRYCPIGCVDYYDGSGNLHPGNWRDENVSLKSIKRVGSNNANAKVKYNRDLLASYLTSTHGANGK